MLPLQKSIYAVCMLLVCCFQCSMCAIHRCAEDMLSTFTDLVFIALIYSKYAALFVLACVQLAYHKLYTNTCMYSLCS